MCEKNNKKTVGSMLHSLFFCGHQEKKKDSSCLHFALHVLARKFLFGYDVFTFLKIVYSNLNYRITKTSKLYNCFSLGRHDDSDTRVPSWFSPAFLR